MGSQIDLQKRNYLNKLPQGCLIKRSLLMNSFCKAEVGHNILIAAFEQDFTKTKSICTCDKMMETNIL
jgi:hypothetical protein